MGVAQTWVPVLARTEVRNGQETRFHDIRPWAHVG
jgi:hypothetical protein